MYDEKKGAITSVAYPKYSLSSYQGWLYLSNIKSKNKRIVKEFPKTVQKFFFDDKTSALTTLIDGVENRVAIWGQPKLWEWAEVATS